MRADIMQTTVNAPVAFTGIGVHSGASATATVRPARAGSGYVFRRVDLDEAVGRTEADLCSRG